MSVACCAYGFFWLARVFSFFELARVKKNKSTQQASMSGEPTKQSNNDEYDSIDVDR